MARGPPACRSRLSILQGVRDPTAAGGQGPVTRSCRAFLRDRISQPGIPGGPCTWKGEFRVFLSSAGIGLPGRRQVPGDGMLWAPSPGGIFWAGLPPLSRHDHWPRAAHSCPLLQRVAQARPEIPLLGGAYLLAPHHLGSPHTMTETPGVHKVHFASIWNQPCGGRILCSRVPVGSD